MDTALWDGFECDAHDNDIAMRAHSSTQDIYSITYKTDPIEKLTNGTRAS
jgi:hypothetical protein